MPRRGNGTIKPKVAFGYDMKLTLYSIRKLNIFSGASLCLTQQRQICHAYVHAWRMKGVETVSWTSNSVQERLYFLNDLRIPVLTDKLSDFQNELVFLNRQKID